MAAKAENAAPSISLAPPLEAEPVSALMRLYLEKRPDLVRFFAARAGARGEAEDLVQELYFKVRHAPAGEISNETAYLYRLGLNLMLDRRRAAMRSRRREHDYRAATAHLAADGEEMSDAPSAEAAADARQRLDRLTRAVETLPPQCRRAFLLHKIEGLSHVEVAQRMGVSRSAVEKHMINALRRLAEALTERLP
ncbi:MAG: sigma-70 family RNA polymerase sigma factor [Hyphomonadaceae bacterium]